MCASEIHFVGEIIANRLEGIAESLALIAADPRVVLLYESYYEPLPITHYRQPDLCIPNLTSDHHCVMEERREWGHLQPTASPSPSTLYAPTLPALSAQPVPVSINWPHLKKFDWLLWPGGETDNMLSH